MSMFEARAPLAAFRRFPLIASVGLLAVVAVGCPKGGDDPGTLAPDVCNSKEEALSEDQCALAVNGDVKEGYIGAVGDLDWYRIVLPSTITGRSLLQVTAGYGGAPGTPVDFSAAILKQDGSTALSTGVDRPTGAPHYVNLVLTLDATYAGQTLLVLVKDDLNAQRDTRNPYRVQVVVQDNPDVNEPNDTTPTPITMSGGTGTASGYLATPNDVDQFSFPVPNGRKIAYIHVTAPTLTPPAPPTLALSYELYNQSNVKISEGRALPLSVVDLATARLSPTTGGTYRLVVKGYKATANLSIPGDLRYKYDITVQTMDDVDANDLPSGNDTFATAKAVSAGTFTSRISYVGDADWFAVNTAGSGARTLHYRLVPSNTAGRFAKLPGPVDRLVRAFTNFTLGSAVCQDANNNIDCPKDLNNSLEKDTALAFCTGTPNLCLRSQRVEDSQFANLRNFEGVIPIPAGMNTMYLVVQDEGVNWADDSNYTLTVSINADSDENTRQSLPSETEVQGIPDVGGFTEAPAGAVTLSGNLSYGHGYLINHLPTQGQGVRAPHDYDGQVTDADRFQLTFPSGSSSKAWALRWEIDPVAGTLPSDLVVTAEFCSGPGAGCTPVTETTSGATFDLFYVGGNRASWQNLDAGAPNYPVWDRSGTSPQVTTALAAGCFCIEPILAQSGFLYLTVSSADRNTWDPVTYRVKTALATYPQTYGPSGSISCPPDPPGCRFTHQ